MSVSGFLRNMLTPQATPQSIPGVLPSSTTLSASAIQAARAVNAAPQYLTPGMNNPFMVAYGQANNNTLMQTFGQNKPLRQPMLLGYRDNKPLLVGSRLFVLY